jgi:hypothetical protein
MNKVLKEAIREVEALPEADQEELAQALLTMAAQANRCRTGSVGG